MSNLSAVILNFLETDYSPQLWLCTSLEVVETFICICDCINPCNNELVVPWKSATPGHCTCNQIFTILTNIISKLILLYYYYCSQTRNHQAHTSLFIYTSTSINCVHYMDINQLHMSQLNILRYSVFCVCSA